MSIPSDPVHPKATLPVRLSFASADEFIDHYLRDPDLGGIFIPTHIDMPVGTPIDLNIDLGGRSTVEARGEIVWVRHDVHDAGIGVLHFVSVDDDHRDWLARAHERRSGRRPGDNAAHLLREVTSGEALDEASFDAGALHHPRHNVVGIDLGTCFSCACVTVAGTPQIIAVDPPDPERPDPDTPPPIPTILAFIKNRVEKKTRRPFSHALITVPAYYNDNQRRAVEAAGRLGVRLLPLTIGLGVGQRFKPIFPRNTPLPCSKRVRIDVPRRRWDTYQLDIWQGVSRTNAHGCSRG